MKLSYQALRPVAFLTVQLDGLRNYWLYAPIAITVVLIGLGLVVPISVPIVGPNSMSDYLSGFFVSLPGFYIAALSAVVAFQGGDLDKEMEDIKARIFWNGDHAVTPVTLRVFLSYLFSYLVVVSILGFFLCLLGNIAGLQLYALLNEAEHAVTFTLKVALPILYAAFVLFLASTIVCVTALGLYFLAERVHQKL